MIAPFLLGSAVLAGVLTVAVWVGIKFVQACRERRA
ncbi:hypothetical protein SUDANB6_05960 [Streptomyces sp. enrichment culture]